MTDCELGGRPGHPRHLLPRRLPYEPNKPRAVPEAAYPGTCRNVDSVRLHDSGPRGAPAVILLHGFRASLDTFAAPIRAPPPSLSDI